MRSKPSAVNKQPWRAVVCGDTVHFYEKHNKGYGEGGWDIQRIDLGIALAHFELAAKESGLSPALTIADPGIAAAPDTEYVASFRV